ncbi:hypothetical protein [Pseudomonas viridiflava]|uniref:hypothetical protein n=1 Tax=Pseudomonas viridiflava TaxID=33069 RepID=UPI000F06B34D|nr:hypothetical protein [Pseudomonas viridiflava]
MRDITEKNEQVVMIVTTEAAHAVDGRTVQIKIANPDGSFFRQQFDLVEGKTEWTSVPLKLVDGNVRFG